MLRFLTIITMAVCGWLVCVEASFAQGRGNSFNRGLGAAVSKGAQGTGVGRPSEQVSRAVQQTPPRPSIELGNGIKESARAGGAIHRVAPRNSAGPIEGIPGANQLRIQEQRVRQAEHLRAVSSRNANEALLETADRMEANATRNFERQTGVAADAIEQPATFDSRSSDHPVISPREAKPVKRGFWIRSR